MAKQPATMSGKKPAKKVEGHEIQQPRLLDRDHEHEISRRNDESLVGYTTAAGIEPIESPTVEKTADVKEKDK